MTKPRRSPLSAALLAATLASTALPAAQALAETTALPDYVTAEFGHPPEVPSGAISEGLGTALRVIFLDGMSNSIWGVDQTAALYEIATSEDPRLAWILSDMLRFAWQPEIHRQFASAAAGLLGIEVQSNEAWGALTDHLIAWDIPAYPGYLEHKRMVFTQFIPGWEQIFTEGDIDWRLVSWGGVLIDNRPFDPDRLCNNCIPASDNPQVVPAAEATWPADDAVVFGVEVNGEARAYPRQIMEVREMVNDTLGGRDLGIPYCTLCGAAQAFFTDDLPDGVGRPVLRTSGLLSRSNKVMYDVNTYSVFDTFLGKALTGPLGEIGLQLDQATVITTTWGEWKAAHPKTTVLAERLALGRNFDFRNGRDKDGPIFPIGDVDPRLPVQEDIIGVVSGSGKPLAFQRSTALLALRAGAEVRVEGVRLELSGGGIRAVSEDGADLGSHQAFWFAWSQFYPNTELWTG